VTHNWQVSDQQDGAVGPASDPGDPPAGPGGPRPIPELVGYGDAVVAPPRTGRPGDDGPTGVAGRPGGPDGRPVTDDDRNRYGLLLDRAAEGGLLASHEYEVRLRELASASTVDEMHRIVTELPAFTGPLPTAGRWRAAAAAGPAGLTGPRKRRTNTRLMMVVLVLVLVVSMVVVYISAQHLTRIHNGGLWMPPEPGLSALRL